jgi:hypothetical protein
MLHSSVTGKKKAVVLAVFPEGLFSFERGNSRRKREKCFKYRKNSELF